MVVPTNYPLLTACRLLRGKCATVAGHGGRGGARAAVGATCVPVLYDPIKHFANSKQNILNGVGVVVTDV